MKDMGISEEDLTKKKKKKTKKKVEFDFHDEELLDVEYSELI